MRLSIQVRLDGLSFFTKDLNTGEVVYEKRSFTKTDPAGLLPEIQTIFNAQTVLKESFDQVDVLYVNDLFTLVPEQLFDKNNLTDYLKFNTKILSTDFIAYDVLETHEIVNVYIPYANVNNFFIDTYGSFTYHHAISKLVTTAITNYGQNEEPVLVVNINTQDFQVVAVRNKKLTLANSFDYRTKEDFIYHLLFTLEQLQYSPETTKVWLAGEVSMDSTLYTIAYTYIRNLQIVTSHQNALPQEDFLLSTLL